jgi:N,N-dimethylformamidase
LFVQGPRARNLGTLSANVQAVKLLTEVEAREKLSYMANPELPVTGYLDRFSHRPGETFSCFVSVPSGGSYRARLIRVVSGDPNPAGPGLRYVDCSDRYDRTFSGRHQPISLGSYGIVDRGPPCDAAAARTWTALICPGIVDQAQAVLSEGPVVLGIGPDGACHGALATGAPMRKGAWYRIWLSIRPATGDVVIGQQRLDGGPPHVAHGRMVVTPEPGAVLIGAENSSAPTGHFTGKIEAPAILSGFVETWPDVGRLVVAAWEFSRGIASQSFTDTGPHSCHGRLINLPTRAVVGASWTGAEHCWRHAPAEYAAIHFHADDLGDCGWEPDFTWTVPDDLPSGAYAFHLTSADGEDRIPFYILPKRNGPFAPIAFLASTFTYQAYANHSRAETDQAYFDRVAAWEAVPGNPVNYPVYGRSLYNVHLDGSGISFSSRRRPILSMRPGFVTFNDPRGSGLRHYPADTHLLAWLEDQGFDFDIITDEDLDEEGLTLLRPYRTVLTGSHPEYHTPRTLDALLEYTKTGGKMVYLGGNGFYWRVARDPSIPWAIELRRAEGGVRTWAARPGEYYHQTDGQMGGLWRRNRRPPQQICGVGFSSQGRFEGTHYRLLPTARDPRYAWVFDGINDDIIGDYGLSGGGAAGFELDRADDALGTPDGTVILARSENPTPSHYTVPEEVLAGHLTISGEAVKDLVRAEMVYFERAGGGAVFSVGSITFCGSLWRNGFEGPVSRLLHNVVRRFCA